MFRAPRARNILYRCCQQPLWLDPKGRALEVVAASPLRGVGGGGVEGRSVTGSEGSQVIDIKVWSFQTLDIERLVSPRPVAERELVKCAKPLRYLRFGSFKPLDTVGRSNFISQPPLAACLLFLQPAISGLCR